jgi:hypothetical protein
LDVLRLTVKDFEKSKRARSKVSCVNRCIAKRADGVRCSRRRKGEKYCGTHKKGQPYGITSFVENEENVKLKKVMIWAEDIKGIMYYIDNENNVYETSDVINNKKVARVIGKYEKSEGGNIVLLS